MKLAGKTEAVSPSVVISDLTDANTEVDSQANLIAQIEAALEGKAGGGGGLPTQEKAVSITENGTVEVVPDNGYVLSKVTAIVNVASSIPDPSDIYQRVEYITSDVDSYFITDFIADNDCGIEMVASFSNFVDHACMGAREDSGNTRFYASYPLSATNTYFGFNSATKVSTSTLTVNTVYRMQTNFLNSRLANVYDEAGDRKGSTAISATLTTQSFPICIFRYNNAGTPATTSRVLSLYNARCSQKNEVVREYIPCYRKSDGEIGLYEKCTGQFLTNAGTGAFTKGADIEW